MSKKTFSDRVDDFLDKYIQPLGQLFLLWLLGMVIVWGVSAIFGLNENWNWWEQIIGGIIIGSIVYGLWQNRHDDNSGA